MMTDSLEASDYTSIQQRLIQWQSEQSQTQENASDNKLSILKNNLPLMPPISASNDNHAHVIGYLRENYLELVDWAGRSIHEGKHGFISEDTPSILNHLGLDPDNFIQSMQEKKPHLSLSNALGKLEKLQGHTKQHGGRMESIICKVQSNK